MKLLAVLALLPALLPAQIDSISSTASGDRIFFTTWLRPTESDHSLWRKAYALENGAVSLFDQGTESAWRVDGVSLSADGEAIAINRSNRCNYGTGCVALIQEFSEIRTSSWTRDLEGYAEIAPGGGFALLKRTTGFGIFPTPDVRAQALQRVDLSSPDSVPEPLGHFPASRGRWIADDGTVLVNPVQGSGWTFVPVEGEPVRIDYPSKAADAAFLLADASAVVYQASDPDAGPDDLLPGELRIRYRDGTEASLGVSGILEDVSPDGLVLYTVPEIEGARQPFLLQLPGGVARQAAELPGGVEIATLLPDGSAILALSQGKLIRIDLGDGRVDSLLGPLPYIDRGNPAGFAGFKPYTELQVPGSTYRMYGAYLAETTTIAPEPAGLELDGFRVWVNDTPAAVLWTSPFEVAYQVAWDTPLTMETTTILRHEAWGWEAARATFEVAEARLRSALPMIGDLDLAVHQDFDRLVTPGDPALPGEYIHIYATGLGPTEPRVELGRRSPSDPLAVATGDCVWALIDENGGRPTEVAFAGLAPGLVGFYQIVWRVPEDVRGDVVRLACPNHGSLGSFPVRGVE